MDPQCPGWRVALTRKTVMTTPPADRSAGGVFVWPVAILA